ncbi:ATP-grasp domain-containing protein [Myceligenerans halotolerans]
MTSLLLVPADPLAPRLPDLHYAREAEAAREAGWGAAVVDHDVLLAGDPGALRRVPAPGPDAGDDAVTAWYRGWMLPAPAYARFAAMLASRGIHLATDPGAYRRAHELPGWYDVFTGLTPASAWLPWEAGRTPSYDDVAGLTAPLGGGPGVVKDYVKSRKHEWHEACFVPDLADIGAATRVVARLVELQDQDLVGGIVARAFESFRADDAGRTREARVWWVGGEPALVTSHPDTPESAPEVPAGALDDVGERVRALGTPFVTTDLAERSDGAWRVIEVGDGQVSDLPAGQDPSPILRSLARA